ncbi:MAG: hypothetical protein ACLTXH_05940 [Enterobacter hormaechei]
MAAWGSGIAMAVGGGVIMALSAAVRRRQVAVPGMACALRLPCRDPCGCGAGSHCWS